MPGMKAGPGWRYIIKRLGSSREDAAMVEDVMRRFVFHSTLGWQIRAELDRGTWEAQAMLEADREIFAQDYAGRRRVFEEMKTCGEAA